MATRKTWFLRNLETYKVQDGLNQIDEWSIRQTLKPHYTVFAGKYPGGDIVGTFARLKDARESVKQMISKSGGAIIEVVTEPHHDYRANAKTK